MTTARTTPEPSTKALMEHIRERWRERDEAMALLQRAQQEVGEHLLHNKDRVPAVADALMAAYPNKVEGAEIARILTA